MSGEYRLGSLRRAGPARRAGAQPVVPASPSSWRRWSSGWSTALEPRVSSTAAKWEPFLTGDLWKTYLLPGIQGTLRRGAGHRLAAGLGFAAGLGRLSPTAIRSAVRRWSSSSSGPSRC